MRKKSNLLNSLSNLGAATVGKSNDDTTHVHTYSSIDSLLLARKVTLKNNLTIERLQSYTTREKDTYWQESLIWRKSQFIRLLSAFILLLVGLFFQYGGGIPHATISIFYILAIVVGGFRLFHAGVQNLIELQVDIQTLMFLPLIGILILGYWLEGAIFVLLLSINEAIETHSINIAKRSMQKVLSLAPQTAVVQHGEKLVTMNVTEVDIDEIVVVHIGEPIPLDGVIVSGATTVDEKVITGQSNSITKHAGDEVFAGSLNEREEIFIKVKKHAHETKIAEIINLVKEAQTTKAPAQHFLENFMAYYTPLVMLLAFFIATLPPLVAGANWDKWVYLSFAILVVACPCALIISTPITFIASLSHVANNGILVKNAASIEKLSRIKGVAFDQIGTLTVGKPLVTDLVSFIDDEDQLIQLSASISQNSYHPFSKTIVEFAKEKDIKLKNVLRFQTIAGKGSFGIIDGNMYTVGSSELLNENHHVHQDIWTQMEQFQREGKSIITVSTSTKLIGFFALQDEVRPEAKTMIQALKKERIKRLFLLTENNDHATERLAKQLGIEHFFANLLPDMKATKINTLRNVYSHIAFVSPKPEQLEEKLISYASVNIANLANTNEDSLSNADIIFLRENLTKLPALIHFSKRTIRTVKNNIFIIFLLKIVALLLVIPNILTLWMAVSVDIIATIIILINTLRLTK